MPHNFNPLFEIPAAETWGFLEDFSTQVQIIIQQDAGVNSWAHN